MKLSIVIPVLNSHEVVRRQLLYWQRINVPEDVEIILVDDGSDPPLAARSDLNLYIHRTNDTRPWTQPAARNIGASFAVGDYLLFTDIDHIVTRKAIEFGRTCKYDFARFRRELGVLNKEGLFSQGREDLTAYGVPPSQGLRISCHTLSMVIRRTVFETTGGFREKLGTYPTHDDGNMKGKLKRLQEAGKITKCPDAERPTIYMIPNGRYCGEKDCNPFGFFHDLTRTNP